MCEICRLFLISTIKNSPAVYISEYEKNHSHICLIKNLRDRIFYKRLLSNYRHLLTHSPKMNTQVPFSSPHQIWHSHSWTWSIFVTIIHIFQVNNMYNIIYEMNHQSTFNAWYWMLGAGALGRPRGMVWGGRREEGSGWGAHVDLWRIHFDVWQN